MLPDFLKCRCGDHYTCCPEHEFDNAVTHKMLDISIAEDLNSRPVTNMKALAQKWAREAAALNAKLNS